MKIINVSIGVIWKKNSNSAKNSGQISFWMQQRQSWPYPGKWEFPGGKIEETETPWEALLRELEEEVQWNLSFLKDRPRDFQIYRTEYDNKMINIHAFLIEGKNFSSKQGMWFKMSNQQDSSELMGKIPQINHKIIDEALKTLLKSNELSPL